MTDVAALRIRAHCQTLADSVVQRRPKAALILGLSARVDSGASSTRHGLRAGAAERVFPTAGQGSEGSRRSGVYDAGSVRSALTAALIIATISTSASLS